MHTVKDYDKVQVRVRFWLWLRLGLGKVQVIYSGIMDLVTVED